MNQISVDANRVDIKAKSGTLYVVATPIGNIKDITYRAVEVLQDVDFIAAEDTRHTGRLLQHYQISTPCMAIHEHNERAQSSNIVERLQQGQSIALVSDAGTPLISDPGYPLVKRVREEGLPVVAIPGACAAVAALSVSGLPSDRFVFEGFLSAKTKARRDRLELLKPESRTLVFYEAPHRIQDTLLDMVDVFGAAREAVFVRELTKRFETVLADKLAVILQQVKDDPNQSRGEIVLLVHGMEGQSRSETEQADRVLALLIEELPVKQAVTLAAKITGAKKNALYQQALRMQSGDEES